MRELVVCRYQESLNWLWEASKLVDVITVYNKGEPMSPDDPLKAIVNEECLENVGREAHSILKHIVRREGKLADETFFCQGDPFPHCKDYFNKLSSPMHSMFEYQTDLYAMTDGDGKPWMGDYDIPVWEFGAIIRYLSPWKAIPNQILFGAYSQFSLKSKILNRHHNRSESTVTASFTVEAAKFLINELETTYRVTTESLQETTTRKQRGAWAIERLWMQIFC